jgi:hypothetical protein
MGFVAMLIAPPRWRWFLLVTLAGGLLWLGTFFYPTMADTGTLSWWQLVPAAIGLGMANTAAGAAPGWALRYMSQKALLAAISRRRARSMGRHPDEGAT